MLMIMHAKERKKMHQSEELARKTQSTGEPPT